MLKKHFFNIDFVYMHHIILDMGKLLSVVKADKSTLSELEKIAPPLFKKEIKSLRKKHKSIIEKITTNRNKIIAHIDISDFGSYFKLGFSNVEINRKVADYTEYTKSRGKMTPADIDVISRYQKLRAASPKEERYSPSDFIQEKDAFKEITSEVLQIARRMNQYFYNIQ